MCRRSTSRSGNVPQGMFFLFRTALKPSTHACKRSPPSPACPPAALRGARVFVAPSGRFGKAQYSALSNSRGKKGQWQQQPLYYGALAAVPAVSSRTRSRSTALTLTLTDAATPGTGTSDASTVTLGSGGMQSVRKRCPFLRCSASRLAFFYLERACVFVATRYLPPT